MYSQPPSLTPDICDLKASELFLCHRDCEQQQVSEIALIHLPPSRTISTGLFDWLSLDTGRIEISLLLLLYNLFTKRMIGYVTCKTTLIAQC